MKTPEVIVMETDDPVGETAKEEKGADELPAEEESPLLSLPSEILQNILVNMDSATYFISLLSCRTVFGAAQSRRVVLHHLNRLPGLRLGLENLDSVNLFESFRKRAAESLSGAGVLADVTTYESSDDLVNISRTVFSPSKSPLMATAYERGQVSIHELRLTKPRIRLKSELRTETYFDEEFQCNYAMEIVKMTFSHEEDLAVLCRTKTAKEAPSPFPKDKISDLQSPRRLYKLVTFHRCHARTKGHFYSSDQSVPQIPVLLLRHLRVVRLLYYIKGHC